MLGVLGVWIFTKKKRQSEKKKPLDKYLKQKLHLIVLFFFFLRGIDINIARFWNPLSDIGIKF